MQRLLFPFLLGLLGAIYPLVTTLQAWGVSAAAGGNFASEADLADALFVGVPVGLSVGVVVGFIAAFNDWARHGARPQRGASGAGRLGANLWWLGLGAMLLNGFNALLLVALANLFASPTWVNYWFPGLLFPLFGAPNLIAILWATTRSISANDVLSPRLWFAKLRRPREQLS